MIECDKYVFERVRWLNSLSDAPNFQETDRTTFFEIIFNEPDNLKLTAQHSHLFEFS